MTLYHFHRQVLEKKLGRKLLPGEQCHHKDHNPFNGKPENLEALPIKEHNIETFKGKDALYKYLRYKKTKDEFNK